MRTENCSCGQPSITYASYVTDDMIVDPDTREPIEWENPFCATCLAQLIEWQNRNNPRSLDGVGWTITLYPPREVSNEQD